MPTFSQLNGDIMNLALTFLDPKERMDLRRVSSTFSTQALRSLLNSQNFVVTKIASGDKHTWMIGEQQPRMTPLFACGMNKWGQLGNGNNTPETRFLDVSAQLPTGFRAVDIRAGGCHTFVLAKNQELGTVHLFAAGMNCFGQFGNKTKKDSNSLIEIDLKLPPDFNLVDAQIGGLHSLFLARKIKENKVFSCGSNGSGQLGVERCEESMSVETSQYLPEGFKAVLIRAGNLSSLIVAVNEKTQNTHVFEFGHKVKEKKPTEISINLPPGFEVIDAQLGGMHTLILAKNSLSSKTRLFAWSKNNCGQLGSENNLDAITEISVSLPEGFFITAIQSGAKHSVLLATHETSGETKVFACGDNSSGQLGIADVVNQKQWCEIPIPLPIGFRTTAIHTGQHQTFVLAQNGFGNSCILACGSNSHHQLGIEDSKNQNSWIEVSLKGRYSVTKVEKLLRKSRPIKA